MYNCEMCYESHKIQTTFNSVILTEQKTDKIPDIKSNIDCSTMLMSNILIIFQFSSIIPRLTAKANCTMDLKLIDGLRTTC